MLSRWLANVSVIILSIQTNHLGTALLAFLMLPYLRKAQANPPTPRLTIVSSDRHYVADITEEERKAPNLLEKLSDEAYCDTKYVNIPPIPAFS